jgi:hypothetical protein
LLAEIRAGIGSGWTGRPTRPVVVLVTVERERWAKGMERVKIRREFMGCWTEGLGLWRDCCKLCRQREKGRCAGFGVRLILMLLRFYDVSLCVCVYFVRVEVYICVCMYISV